MLLLSTVNLRLSSKRSQLPFTVQNSSSKRKMSSTYGCEHYRRAVKLLAPCCNKIYVCRVCHNMNEDHILNPKSVQVLVCQRCNTRQKVSRRCHYCDVLFGQYVCIECRLFDQFKEQYHCAKCGICRIGPPRHYFHCPKCNLCMNVLFKNNHECIEDVSRNDCPICLEDLHTSRVTLILLECGHLLHDECYEQLLSTENKSVCPICRKELKKRLMSGDVVHHVFNAEPTPSTSGAIPKKF